MMNAGNKRLDSRSKDPANFTQNLGKTSMSQTQNQPFNRTPKGSKDENMTMQINSTFLPNIKSRNVGGQIYGAQT